MTAQTASFAGPLTIAVAENATEPQLRYAPGTPVMGKDGRIGTVAGVRVDHATNEPLFLLVRQPRLFGLVSTTRVIPAALASHAGAAEIALPLTRAEAARFPSVRDDQAIREDAWEIVRRHLPARSWRRAVRVTVQDGIVTLEGHARYPDAARTLASAVSAVAGVVSVRNHIYDDEALVNHAIAALARDPDTRQAHLRVASSLGEVSLSGTLPSEAAIETATQLAGAVAGVKRVDTHIDVQATRRAAASPQPCWSI